MRKLFNFYKTPGLKAHECKCFKMFDDIKNGNRLYISIEWIVSGDEPNNIYINKRAFEDKQYVRVSLLTDDIIDYDIETFRIEDRTELSSSYRPYFASFIVPLEDNVNALRNIGSGWYYGQFTVSRDFAPDEVIILDGTLETSASPVNYLDGMLLVFKNRAFDKATLDKINSAYDPYGFVFTSSSDIEKILNSAWAGDLPDTIDIYNVGHGNADYIRGKNHRILYDVGYNYRCFPGYCSTRYLKAATSIRHLKPSCVILSHWDMDHIIGCAYAEQGVFSKKWIAPSLVSKTDKSTSPNSVRLANYLKALDNLCLVDRNLTPKLIATISCAKTVEIKLWLGGGTSILTSKNREGLMLEIIDNNSSSNSYPHILLAGDVPYKCMPNNLKVPIDFMHVPHHCSNMELVRLGGIPGKGICAIISTNRKKGGGFNYNSNHHDELKNKFHVVINTIDSPSGDDEENRSIQIKYVNKYNCYCIRRT